MRYSFREFLQLDEGTKTRLGTLRVNEDLSGNQKEKKLKDLEKKLKSCTGKRNTKTLQRYWC
jgi:uncharacterized membrane protein YukC